MGSLIYTPDDKGKGNGREPVLPPLSAEKINLKRYELDPTAEAKAYINRLIAKTKSAIKVNTEKPPLSLVKILQKEILSFLLARGYMDYDEIMADLVKRGILKDPQNDSSYSSFFLSAWLEVVNSIYID